MVRIHRRWTDLLLLLPLAALETACAGGGAAALPRAASTRPNIVLVTIDTLRADHLGCYGYGRPTSPRIDRLAGEGVRFEHAYAPSSWTVPSMISLITGVSPAVHRIVHGDIKTESPQAPAGAGTRSDAGAPGPGAPPAGISPVSTGPGGLASGRTVVFQEILSDGWTTLAEALHSRGYTTAGFSTNGHLIRTQGYAQGFDVWDESCAWGIAECVNREVFDWLDARKPASPFFLWVHYFDPHHDTTRPGERRYDPPAPYDTMFRAEGPPLGVERSVALYDGEVRYTDEAIGALLDRVLAAASPAPTMIVLTADHGDEFLERGNWYHAKTVYDELVHVPLVFVLPGRESAGRSVGSFVSLLDIMPTLLETAGVPPVAGVEGLSLRPLLARKGGESAFPRRPLYSETRRWEWLDRRCWIEDGKKLMVDLKTGSRALYDLGADPGEKTDLSPGSAADVDRMSREMKTYLDGAGVAASAHPVPLRNEQDADRLEKLRSLGYIN